MFVDKVQIQAKAGNGGKGALSFRHEKFVDRGGPDGGDGGDGGSIVLVATRNLHTLSAFRYQKLVKAEDGKPGLKQRKHGRRGKDHVALVPLGTQVYDEQGQLLADLTLDDQRAVVAAGGKGGFGNAHFISSVRQAPRIAEKGERGQELLLNLELKMIADVGLVGLPNAGKSTLLATVSNARPDIADYPFTTLRPNLGVVDVAAGKSLLMADIPGLIEGASRGKGLGDEFLRHIERTTVFLHLIDVTSADVIKDYKTVQGELAAYRADLTKKPQIVALTKLDGFDDAIAQKTAKALQKVLPKNSLLFRISSHSKSGISELLFELVKVVDAARQEQQSAEDAQPEVPVIRLPDTADWTITRIENGYRITGKKINSFASRTDFSSEAGTDRLMDVSKKMGILQAVEKKGIEPGQRIVFGDYGHIEY